MYAFQHVDQEVEFHQPIPKAKNVSTTHENEVSSSTPSCGVGGLVKRCPPVLDRDTC